MSLWLSKLIILTSVVRNGLLQGIADSCRDFKPYQGLMIKLQESTNTLYGIVDSYRNSKPYQGLIVMLQESNNSLQGKVNSFRDSNSFKELIRLLQDYKNIIHDIADSYRNSYKLSSTTIGIKKFLQEKISYNTKMDLRYGDKELLY